MSKKKATPAPTPRREVRSFKLSSQPIEVRTNPDGSRSITGIAAPFNSQSVDLGGFAEIIAPGAFKRTLVENPDVLCLRDHKQELLLGRTKSGTLNLSESAAGLRFTCKLPNTTQAADLIESLSRGDIDSCSFGFVTVDDSWAADNDGNVIRTLLDVDLLEISVVSFPAYPDSTAALRSCPVTLRCHIKRSADENPCDPDSSNYDPDDPNCTSDDDDSEDDEEDRCDCNCESCESGDCTGCTNTECDDDTCEGCPMQDDTRSDKLRIRQLFQHRTKHHNEIVTGK